jgi:hypothetical protein
LEAAKLDLTLAYSMNTMFWRERDCPSVFFCSFVPCGLFLADSLPRCVPLQSTSAAAEWTPRTTLSKPNWSVPTARLVCFLSLSFHFPPPVRLQDRLRDYMLKIKALEGSSVETDSRRSYCYCMPRAFVASYLDLSHLRVAAGAERVRVNKAAAARFIKHAIGEGEAEGQEAQEASEKKKKKKKKTNKLLEAEETQEPATTQPKKKKKKKLDPV